MSQNKDISEESTSTTLSEGLTRSLVLKQLLDKQVATEILKRTLSVGSVQSTASSFAERMKAAGFDNRPDLRDIGRGTCGSVFEIPGTTQAIKKGANADSIWTDFCLTNCAYNSYLSWARLLAENFPGRRTPRVPRARNFHGPEAHEFWTASISRFPKEDQTTAAVFYLDRILPVPSLTREALIRQFYQDDKQVQHDVHIHPPNRDCLIRVYFGENKPDATLYGPTDSLRNFPLYLDQAKMVGLNVNAYAEEMAMGLAILHWQAQIDAQDTEFVIGNSTVNPFAAQRPYPTIFKRPVSSMDNFSLRETQMWMLDFDKCSAVDLHSKNLSSDIVRKYLVAVTGNDPYFPHPRRDPDLWQQFRKVYLQASEIIITTRQQLKPLVAKLPAMLIKQWELWGDENMAAEEFDPFERNSGQEVEEEEEEEDEGEDSDDSESEVDDGEGDPGEDSPESDA
ncbi:hypothetical protein Z517_07685 [Fonsecaea pedrosoi CBS 271.37]|uniref:DUF3669 domain-containing protein n=1 Tax=Fonsecaea pedrosoi CBS 271.37 TaxID=1442368 RepID=A0A0D2EUC9_9EURO|nr:uncharacterized protein Z517_07685 [Fonsecaea pedrosoi CBS 271.37]KIW77852.1 hypothetical protein Z517_07685 [Fonsecaea pedrosoi CBS 271.37]